MLHTSRKWIAKHQRILSIMGILILLTIFIGQICVTCFIIWPHDIFIAAFFVTTAGLSTLVVAGLLALGHFITEERYCLLVRWSLFGLKQQ